MLWLSAKEEYGLRAMLALSLHEGPRPLGVGALSRSERIPKRFLEQVMGLLKKEGLAESVRGFQGGYRLARPAEQIRLSEVFRAMEGGRLNPIEDTVVREVWDKVYASLEGVLDAICVQDLCEKKRALQGTQAIMFHI